MLYPLTPPLIDMLVLSVIKKEDSYGYQISQQIRVVSNLKDSALYPVLKRLAENQYVEVYDQLFEGRNRKYYHITQLGMEQFEFLYKEWITYTQNIEDIIGIEK